MPKGHVWSWYAGRWRPLKVGSLHAPDWGRPPIAGCIITSGVVLTFPAAAVGYAAVGGVAGILVAAAPAAFFAALLFGSWLPASRRRAAMPTHASLTGQIVKRWTYTSSTEDSTTHYCVCIDDGTSPEGWSFHIDPAAYNRLSMGDHVAVDYYPPEHTVTQIQLTNPPSHAQD